MKKLTVLMVLSALLFFTIGASAQDNATENMKTVGGVTYNTFDGTWFLDGEEAGDNFEDTDLESGFGFYVGGQYWLSDQIGIEAGYDVAKSSDDDFEGSEVDINLSGPYGKGVYKVNEMISLNGGLAYYSFTMDQSYQWYNVEWKGNGIGFLLGGEMTYPISDKISLIGSGNYRLANIDIDKYKEQDVEDTELNMSGLSLRAGISYNF